MEDLPSRQTTVSPRVATSLVDDVIARYIEWRGACDALAGADHQESAEERYAAAVWALQHLLWPKPQAEPSGPGRHGKWDPRCDSRDEYRKPSMSLGRRHRRAPGGPCGDVG
jgi:hypothetical protein